MSKVVLKNLKKSYDGKKNIIDGINLSINDNEFIVLVGSSGCGKSTILRLISGLEGITDGEIIIDDRLVNDVHPKDRDIAFVFQSYALYPHLTVFENIAFGLKMRKFKKDEIREKVLKTAKALNLVELLARKPKELSGGQRQRVALGRAIVRNPKVFLMDEPLSNLDANLRVQMRAEIKRLHKELKTTFIYVTHDQTEALTMGDRIVVLDKGQIQQVDTPEMIYKHPKNKFVAGFIGQMNFINASITDNKLCIENNKICIPQELTEKFIGLDEIIIGVRPENMLNGNIELQTNIEIVEMCGADKNVYFSLNGNKCFAKVPLDFPCNNVVNLKLNFENMFFFNVLTEKNIFID